MTLDYTYFEADKGGYIGYFNDFPQHVTEGETLEELEEMLLDMYECLHLEKYHKRQLVIPSKQKQERRLGTLEGKASVKFAKNFKMTDEELIGL
jgi:predicted RNase H-like HicB family nuclease